MQVNLHGRLPEGAIAIMKRNKKKWSVVSTEDELLAFLPDEEKFAALKRNEYRLLGLPNGFARIIRFADLHRHSDCSLLDGMTKIKDMAAKTEYAGALTDHGNMYGFLEYYKTMRAMGKHPILGFEGVRLVPLQV